MREIAGALRKNVALVTLDLRICFELIRGGIVGNNIRTEGAREIAGAVGGNLSLRTIVLCIVHDGIKVGVNNIGSEGKKALAAAAATKESLRIEY